MILFWQYTIQYEAFEQQELIIKMWGQNGLSFMDVMQSFTETIMV